MARGKAISVKIPTQRVINALETKLVELEANYKTQDENEAKYQEAYKAWQTELANYAISHFSKAENIRTNYRAWNESLNVDFDIKTNGTDFPQEPERVFEQIHRHNYGDWPKAMARRT